LLREGTSGPKSIFQRKRRAMWRQRHCSCGAMLVVAVAMAVGLFPVCLVVSDQATCDYEGPADYASCYAIQDAVNRNRTLYPSTANANATSGGNATWNASANETWNSNATLTTNSTWNGIGNGTSIANTTWNSNMTMNPCGSCQAQVATPSLAYEAYAGPFVDASGCEPAVPWICPTRDRGRCCVAKGTMSVMNSARRLCAARVSDEVGMESVQLTREQVRSLSSGAIVPIPVVLDYMTVFAIRGKWANETLNQVRLHISSSTATNATSYALALDRVSGIASWIDSAGTRLLRADIPEAHETERFEILFSLQWRRMRMYDGIIVSSRYCQFADYLCDWSDS
jgi:hypothetical protein